MIPNDKMKIMFLKGWFYAALLAGNVLFFFMLFAPRTHQDIKVPFLIFVVFVITMRIVATHRLTMHPTVLMWFLLLLIYGSVWDFIAVMRGNPGVIDYLRLNILWVLLYSLFICGIYRKEIVNSLMFTIVLAAIAISLFNIYIVLNAMGFLPHTLLVELDMGNRIGITQGYIQLTAHNIGTLAFVNPFLFAALIFSERERALGINKKWIIVTFVLTLITVIISGRRALWLNVALTPFICLIFVFMLKENDRKIVLDKVIHAIISLSVVFVICGILLISYTSWSMSVFQTRITEAFESGGIRQQQMESLFRNFTEHPVWGTGFGIGVKDIVRDIEHPWDYELSYFLALYNTGIIGMLYYVAMIGWIYLVLVKLLRSGRIEKQIAMPLIVGMSAFLIANATNPYYASYDFMWTTFLPIAYINSALLDKEKTVFT